MCPPFLPASFQFFIINLLLFIAQDGLDVIEIELCLKMLIVSMININITARGKWVMRPATQAKPPLVNP